MTQNEPKSEGPLTSSLERMRQELDRWIESARSQGGRALDMFHLRGEQKVAPRLDLIETDEDIRVVMDLPGVDPNLIQVTIVGNMLTIKGHKPPTPTQARALAAFAPSALAAFARLRAGKEMLQPDPSLDLVEGFLFQLNGQRPDAETARALDAYFIVGAEHGLNASTFAARVIVSTRPRMNESVAW